MKRRGFLAGCSALSAAALVSGCEQVENLKKMSLREILGFPESGKSMSQIERNKALALRFKKAQGREGRRSDDQPVARAGLSPRTGGHGAPRAERGRPGPPEPRSLSAHRLSRPRRRDRGGDRRRQHGGTALPHHRNASRESLRHSGDRARRSTSTKSRSCASTGDWITDGWFMADEAGLLKQLGATLPPRKDGKRIVPAVTGGGEDPDVVLKRIAIGAARLARRHAIASSSRNRNRRLRRRTTARRITSSCGRASSTCAITATRTRSGTSGRRSRCPTARTASTASSRKATRCGCSSGSPARTRRTSMAIRRPAGAWKFPRSASRASRTENGRTGWYFGDELGLMLQLGALHMLG